MVELDKRISKQVLHFSRWCRKGFAVFAALGKEVRISVLSIAICVSSLQKSARRGIIVTTAACWEASGEKVSVLRQWMEYVVCASSRNDDFFMILNLVVTGGTPHQACLFFVNK